MKQWFIIAWLSFCALVSFAQTSIENPYVESSYRSRFGDTKVERIAINSRDTRVYISYSAKTNEDISIAISSKTTLNTGGRRLSILKWGTVADGQFSVLNLNQSYGLNSIKKFTFCLVFPSIPTNSQSIDIEENVSDGFYWRGIRLRRSSANSNNDREDSGSSNHHSQTDRSDSGTSRNDGGTNHNGGTNRNNDNADRNDSGASYNEHHDKNGRENPNVTPRTQRPVETPFVVSASGSGFAINGEGYLATCYHVIEGARRVRIRGVNGDFDHPVMAEIIATDRDNDLAILKITDNSFTGLGNLPYRIKTSGSEVGEEVFTLGYPLRSVMGDEIKLTNGVISACSGYQGDMASYQLSATVQSGNSGCPVFNANGEVIGVVNSRLENIESASYAIKEQYLIRLIQKQGIQLSSAGVRSMANEPMTTKVRTVKPFVYIIEVE